jgi:hypothetical protein
MEQIIKKKSDFEVLNVAVETVKMLINFQIFYQESTNIDLILFIHPRQSTGTSGIFDSL